MAEANEALPESLSLVTIPADLVRIPHHSGRNAAGSHPAECSHKKHSHTALHVPGTAGQALNKVLAGKHLTELMVVVNLCSAVRQQTRAALAEHQGFAFLCEC